MAAESSASFNPWRTAASVAMMPGPPALVIIATRLPCGKGWVQYKAALSNNSAMVSTRIHPHRSHVQRFSSTGSRQRAWAAKNCETRATMALILGAGIGLIGHAVPVRLALPNLPGGPLGPIAGQKCPGRSRQIIGEPGWDTVGVPAHR